MVMSLQTRFEYRRDSSLCGEKILFYLDGNKVNYVKPNVCYEVEFSINDTQLEMYWYFLICVGK